MSEELPLPQPTDPWADAVAAEESTPQIIYAPPPAGRAGDAHEADADLGDASGTVVTDTVLPRHDLPRHDLPRNDIGAARLDTGSRQHTGADTDAIRPARPPVADPPAGRDRPLAPGRPAPGRARLGGRTVIVIAAATAVVLTGIGAAVGQAMSKQGAAGAPTHGPSASTTIGANAGGTAAGTPSAGPASTDPASASPSGPSPVDSARPTSPDQALALSAKQATAELDREADEDEGPLAALAGHWVPQVDGKCVGMNNVDIQPNWQPDGKPDTQNVTVQQILAFHLKLHQRFNALTARPAELGEPATAPNGECAGRPLWYSVVTSTAYDTDTQANAWCDANLIPVNECLARYVPKPGELARTTDRSPAPGVSVSASAAR